MLPEMTNTAQEYLQRLCVEIPNRRVGSAGNQQATEFFASKVASFGFTVSQPGFECIDWAQEGAHLSAGDLHFRVFPSPYSLGCQVRAPLVVVETLAELEQAEFFGNVLLLRGAIAAGQIMPKNFPFYNPEEHRRIIHLLETKNPAAIVTATARDIEMVGSMYPFPLFEDGDFDIPSVYTTDVEGERLTQLAGQEVHLESRAKRIPATGCNVIACKGGGNLRRVVLFAHIDTRMGTPGAGDNASGVIVLLLLAELLAEYTGDTEIELVAMNGEDYFSNPGEQQYLHLNQGKLDQIKLGINIDDVGYIRGRVAYSLYGCTDEVAALIRNAFYGQKAFMEGATWFQGDHGLFIFNSVPALALTSELVAELMAGITHTPRDTPDMVDPEKLALTAVLLNNLLKQLLISEQSNLV